MKIQLGGGVAVKEGFTNIDILPLQGVDIVADLTKGIPLPDNSVDEVVAEHFIPHIPDVVFIMEEIHRVSKDGALVRIKVPYFKSHYACKDVTAKHFFTERTFEMFDRSYIERGLLAEYNIKCNMRMEKVTFNYVNRGTRFIPFVGLLRRFLWDIVRSIVVELRVVKGADSLPPSHALKKPVSAV